MKGRMITFSLILLISLMVAGGTFSWFTSSPDESSNDIMMGIVEVDVIENGLDEIWVKNSGTRECFVRVRLIPQWSDQSLSVSNVEIDINYNSWIEEGGYYYFKESLPVDEKTDYLIRSVDYSELTSEYEGAAFTLKVVAEGIQIAEEAWREVWSIDSLPF